MNAVVALRCVAAAVLLAGAVAISGCQSSGSGNAGASASSASVATMERVMKSAARCWYGSSEADFRPYRLAPELNAIAGPPRLLIVPASAPEGRPLAVIEGRGAGVDAYGPLMAKPIGSRISSDVQRWAGGNAACGGKA